MRCSWEHVWGIHWDLGNLLGTHWELDWNRVRPHWDQVCICVLLIICMPPLDSEVSMMAGRSKFPKLLFREISQAFFFFNIFFWLKKQVWNFGYEIHNCLINFTTLCDFFLKFCPNIRYLNSWTFFAQVFFFFFFKFSEVGELTMNYSQGDLS